MIIHGDSIDILKTLTDNSVDSVVTDPPYGISFMGKKRDYDVPQVELWQEVLRVLKPGGHALVACGTRTQHRMAVNLEDAGFEIRDIIARVYGSGFPKSLNIGKSVDKLQGNERVEVEPSGLTGGAHQKGGGNKNIEDASSYATGTDAKYTKGNSPHEGWGTALKPAMELRTLCRKPLEEKTVAENVLKYGTGGINIDGCRVGTEEISQHGRNSNNTPAQVPQNEYKPNNKWTGRFPANFIHDGSDEVVSGFPYSKSGARKTGSGTFGGFVGNGKSVTSPGVEKSEGNASRFFYCAKASKSERNKGLEGFEDKITDDGRQKSIDNAFQRGETKRKNNHPTVKPVKLMQYLCRMITPKGGTILDPFNGSGTTGIGAKLEGFEYIGIEREKEYVDISNARIEGHKKPIVDLQLNL